MKKRILTETLRRATPTYPLNIPRRSLTGALLIASLMANVVLFRTASILHADNFAMRTYMDAITSNFRNLKSNRKGEVHGQEER